MATYYIDPVNGSDSNNGLGPDASNGTNKPIKTIAKAIAASGLAASGDTVYLAPGTYRESVTAGITPTSAVTLTGDYANAKGFKTSGGVLVNAGEVRWTAYTTNDTSAPGTFALKLNGKNFFTFNNIHFVGGTNTANGSCVDGITVTASHDLIFTQCAFTNGSSLSTPSLVGLTGPGSAAACNYTFDSCWFGPSASGNSAALTVNLSNNSTADYDSGIVVKNCVFVTGGIRVGVAGSGTFKGGNVIVSNCLIYQAGTGVSVQGTNTSSGFPCIVNNCVVYGNSATALISGANATLIEDYNLLLASTARNSVGIGAFSQTSGNYSQLISYGQEAIWSGATRPFGTPLSGSPVLGFGNAVLAAGRSPTCADDATVGSTSWTNPTNASAADATNATATSITATTGTSHYLKATGFSGFAGIPSNATIQAVRVEALVSAGSASAISCNNIKLVKGGTISGNSHASDNTTQFSTSLSTQSWGNTSEPLWGLSLTPTDVQAAGFGVAFSVKNTSGSAVTCNLDFIRVIVAYTKSDGSGGQATDILGETRPAGGLSTSYAVGALERGNTATVQTTTEHTAGSACWQVAGPGFQDFYSNVDAASFTLGVWARYDTSSQQPTVTIKANPAIGINSDVALSWSDPGTNAWAQFTTTQTPTSDGIIQVRCATADGTGNAYFADVTFT